MANIIRILQINMHQGATTHELLAQFITKVRVDVVLINVKVPEHY